jgi:hypothetical protein
MLSKVVVNIDLVQSDDEKCQAVTNIVQYWFQKCSWVLTKC